MSWATNEFIRNIVEASKQSFSVNNEEINLLYYGLFNNECKRRNIKFNITFIHDMLKSKHQEDARYITTKRIVADRTRSDIEQLGREDSPLVTRGTQQQINETRSKFLSVAVTQLVDRLITFWHEYKVESAIVAGPFLWVERKGYDIETLGWLDVIAYKQKEHRVENVPTVIKSTSDDLNAANNVAQVTLDSKPAAFNVTHEQIATPVHNYVIDNKSINIYDELLTEWKKRFGDMRDPAVAAKFTNMTNTLEVLNKEKQHKTFRLEIMADNSTPLIQANYAVNI